MATALQSITATTIEQDIKNVFISKPRHVPKTDNVTFAVRYGPNASKILLELPCLLVKQVILGTQQQQQQQQHSQWQGGNFALQLDLDELTESGASRLLSRFVDGVIEKVAAKIKEYRQYTGPLSTTELSVKPPVCRAGGDDFSGNE